VSRFDEGVAVFGQRRDLIQQPDLVSIIEAVGRLVHDQGVGSLSQSSGNEGQLALSAADFGVALFPEVAHGEPLEGL